MIRTQIQFPDELYAALKTLAAEKEWSLAEVLRRASEEYLIKFPPGRTPRKKWKMPKPRNCGRMLQDPSTFRVEAEIMSGNLKR